MSVEVTNETIWDIDAKAFSDLGLWVMDQMRVSTQSDLTILFVDPDPIAELHERWMSLEGPTDVMSFPMDELRPGDGKTTMEACSATSSYALGRGPAGGRGRSQHHAGDDAAHHSRHPPPARYDHVTPEQERQMFGLQRQLLLTFWPCAASPSNRPHCRRARPTRLPNTTRRTAADGR